MIDEAKVINQKMIEFYHDGCLIPDWAYYQLNGKNAMENYIDQKNQMSDNLNIRRMTL
ncbi:MAG: hypothetical protein IKS18_06870 [Lachnospiraceae bacterium]|nr:hypothetical protein [Lachnospiraceae bacterium]